MSQITRYLFLFHVFLMSFVSFSQNNEGTNEIQEFSFSELLHRIEEDTAQVYTLNEASILFDPESDTVYNIMKYRFSEAPFPKTFINIRKAIVFDNVKFQKDNNVYNYGYVNIIFHESVTIKKGQDISFLNCEFKKGFSFVSPKDDESNLLRMSNCKFGGAVKIADRGYSEDFILQLNNCDFRDNTDDDHSEFGLNALLNINIGNSNFIDIRDNRITYDSTAFIIQIIESAECYIQNNQINSKSWNYLFLIDLDGFIFSNNEIGANLLFGIDKIESKYNLQWPLTQGKVIPLDYIFMNQTRDQFKNADLDSIYENCRASDDSYYRNELILLSKFHSYFADFHDRQSANNIYIRIKDLETERLAYLNQGNPSFSNYFELQTNRFLKRFSDYGTSPSKIVISSFQIILLFALFFLFSSNSWSKVNFHLANLKIKQSVDYFTTNKSIVSAYDVNEEALNETNKTKEILLKNEKRIPLVFSAFMKLFLWGQKKRLGVKISFWNYLNVVKNNWTGLSFFKRFLNSILFGVILIFYFLYKILIVLINALTLSVNSFTTLGFGEIPIKGIGRYLAILEGFIGWAFLTLFSVTLISQVLS